MTENGIQEKKWRIEAREVRFLYAGGIPIVLDTVAELYVRVRNYLEKTGLSQGDMAQIVGLPVRKFNYYLTEKSQVNLWPLLPKLLQHDEKLSREWLYFGEGTMLVGSQETQQDPSALPQHSLQCACETGPSLFPSTMEHLPSAESPIRLTGLTECGQHGWFTRAYRSVNVSPPRCGEHWVVVQAIGDSMVPHGIMEGYTLFCDPSQPPATGEAVYVLRRDGYATIKLFQGRDVQGRIVLQGWQPGLCAGNLRAAGEERLAMGTEAGDLDGRNCGPSSDVWGTSPRAEGGGQEAYYLYCSPADIAQLAPVIYIKCRL